MRITRADFREQTLLQKKGTALEEHGLIQKELATESEKLDKLSAALKDVGDLKNEIRGLKLSIGRLSPSFKKDFPEITKEMTSKT
jgi:argonaute-like protein implicated in RNA metabolism and viral defense